MGDNLQTEINRCAVGGDLAGNVMPVRASTQINTGIRIILYRVPAAADMMGVTFGFGATGKLTSKVRPGRHYLAQKVKNVFFRCHLT
ncbi:MAG TPA: hypothetical protein P5160_09205, partial [Candidatus Omnitrophota bacterium]|nr:hypothetical protein [Candidatus Omnitrophota bacterium]